MVFINTWVFIVLCGTTERMYYFCDKANDLSAHSQENTYTNPRKYNNGRPQVGHNRVLKISVVAQSCRLLCSGSTGKAQANPSESAKWVLGFSVAISKTLGSPEGL
jgi:hypothetical protein